MVPEDVLKFLIGADPVPAIVPEATVLEVTFEVPREKSTYLYVDLPGQPAQADLVDRLLERGTVAFVAEAELPSTRRVTWLDTRRPGADWSGRKVELPVGLIVADVPAALMRIARMWRAETNAQVIAIVGAEGLRTCQRLTHSVLSQRFETSAPDKLMCDPLATALGVLALNPRSERLLVRLDLSDSNNAAFVTESVRPDVVVLTNTSVVGVEGMAATENLIRSLSENRLAIVNADDPGIAAMTGRLEGHVFRYGLQPTWRLWASQIESQGREGLRLRLHYDHDTVYVRIPLLGRNSVHTALAAAAVGLASMQSWEEIVAGLRTMSEQLHLIVIPGIQGSSLIEDSYEATPSSTLSVLNLLRDLPGRKVAVLGDMTESAPLETEAHRKVGRRVIDVASVLVTVGYLGGTIAREALACGMDKNQVYTFADNVQPVAVLREVLKPGDIVLIAGAGRLGMRHIVDQLADTQTSLCEV